MRAKTDGAAVPAIWRGHFLSLGTGPQRFDPLARLVEQAHAQGGAVFALDPHQRLLPALQGVLRELAGSEVFLESFMAYRAVVTAFHARRCAAVEPSGKTK